MVTNFVSDKAKLGKNVRIWHFAYVGDNTEIGDNVKIGSLAHVDYNVKIGDNTMIEGMVYIPSIDRKSTRLNSSHEWISYAVFCLKKKKKIGKMDVKKRCS